MIKIKGKYEVAGRVVGFLIDEDGAENIIPVRGPYSALYFTEFLESGFVFHDFHGDIVTPDGVNISNVPTLDNPPVQELADMADSFAASEVSEADVVSSFVRKEVVLDEVEFPAPSNVMIHTREEMMEFIHNISLNKIDGRFDHVDDINDIVAEDARFTLEEIIQNPSIISSITTLYECTNINSMDHLVDVLTKAGITSEDTLAVKQRKLLEYFFRRGIPGIKARVVGVSYNNTPKRNIRGTYAPNASINRSSDFHEHVGIKVDATDMVYGVDFARGVSTDEIFNNTNFYEPTGFDGSFRKSIIVSDGVKPGTGFSTHFYKAAEWGTQIVMQLIATDDKTGMQIAYVMRAEAGYLTIIQKAQSEEYETNRILEVPFMSVRNVMGGLLSIDSYLRGGIEFGELYSKALYYVSQKISSRIVEPEYKTMAEVFHRVGISPPWIAEAAASFIIKGKSSVYPTSFYDPAVFSSSNGFHDPFAVAANGLSEVFYRRYIQGLVDEPTEAEYLSGDLDTQLDILSQAISCYVDPETGNSVYRVPPHGMNPNGVVPMDLARDLSAEQLRECYDFGTEVTQNDYEKIMFLKRMVNGTVFIGEYADGIMSDRSRYTYPAAEMIISLYYAVTAQRPGTTVDEFFDSLLDNYISIEDSVPQLVGASNGSNEVALRLYTYFALNSQYLLYVTKAFRNINNYSKAMVDAAGHFGFECIRIPIFMKSVTRRLIDRFTQQIGSHTMAALCKEYGIDESMMSSNTSDNLCVKMVIFKQKNIMAMSGIYAMKALIHYIVYTMSLNQIAEKSGSASTGVEPVSILCDFGSNGSYTIRMCPSKEDLMLFGALMEKVAKERYYSTVDEFSRKQFRDITAPTYFPANAYISPWGVCPTGESRIPSYNLAVNYFTPSELVSMIGADNYNRFVVQTGGKFVDSLNVLWSSNQLFGSGFGEEIDTAIGVDSDAEIRAGSKLKHGITEDAADYIKRCVFEISQGTNDTEYVLSPRQKADVLYSKIRDGFAPKSSIPATDVIKTTSTKPKVNMKTFLFTAAPTMLTASSYTDTVEAAGLIGDKTVSDRVVVKPFKVKEYDGAFADRKLFSMDVSDGLVVFRYGAFYEFDGEVERRYLSRDLDINKFRQWAAEDRVIQISHNRFVVFGPKLTLNTAVEVTVGA